MNSIDVPNFVSLEKALEYFLAKLQPLGTDVVPLDEAGSRILAEDIYSAEKIPPFDRSPLDGFALRGEDTFGATKEQPIWLEILEEVPAGYMPTKEISPGYATKILTGAPLPEGTTAVIRFEDTVTQGSQVGIMVSLVPGSNICLAGEDITNDELALRKGIKITPGAAGMLAALGHPNVKVMKKPRVSLLSTGDELVGIDQPLSLGKIRNSNIYSLTASVLEAGGIPFNQGVVGDEKEYFLAQLREMLQETDMVVTTGGASVGDYDIVKDVFQELGAELLFWRIAIRPGTAVVGAIIDGKPLIGLSGNPGAAAITFELLVRPLIRFLTGDNNIYRPVVTGTMLDDFNKSSPSRRFLRGRASWQNNSWQVKLTGKQNPGILRSLVESNALIEIPKGTGPLKAGDMVKIIMQGTWEGIK